MQRNTNRTITNKTEASWWKIARQLYTNLHDTGTEANIWTKVTGQKSLERILYLRPTRLINKITIWRKDGYINKWFGEMLGWNQDELSLSGTTAPPAFGWDMFEWASKVSSQAFLSTTAAVRLTRAMKQIRKLVGSSEYLAGPSQWLDNNNMSSKRLCICPPLLLFTSNK